jgi:AraC-like DNA-binding protein
MPIEPHLNLIELILSPAGEWKPGAGCWTLMRIADGFGYCFFTGSAIEFKSAEALVIGPNSDATVRASQLGELRLQYFRVVPERLNGLITVVEWRQLTQIGATPRVFHYPARESLAQRFGRLVTLPDHSSLAARSALLELWASCVSVLLTPMAEPVPKNKKLESVFRQFISKISEKDLAGSSLADLASQLNCSERHLSRLFCMEFGMSFREKQTELSLQRACQLLLEPNAKVRMVAYDTGYRHIGFFNALFKKRFGLTPREWRRQHLPADPSLPPPLWQNAPVAKKRPSLSI